MMDEQGALFLSENKKARKLTAYRAKFRAQVQAL
jgi:hypothetical protein